MTRTKPILTVTVAVVGLALGVTMSTAHAQTPAPPPPAVEQVRLSWVGDSATTMTVRWRGVSQDGRARARAVGSSAWNEVQATALPIGSSTGHDLEVTFTGLQPGTEHEYQVADGGVWSDLYQFHTTSGLGAPVTVAFVADTGIPGRLDGLAAGTAEVLQAIDELDPTLVLGGGDYAYFDSDSRFATQSDAMDAWLRSVESVTTDRPFMPTYGNHEVLLQEQVDAWVARFATPEGDAGRTSYSFDVDGVHFVALLAFEGVLSPATMSWLAADLDAARNRGVRAIIPYMHRNVYGNGTVHDPSPSLGRQLAALFEWYDIDVVLTAHDQSFERTFPLAKGDPTTNARRCYTKADGITWVKTSPGGKLSNISGGFSGYSATPPSPEIAVRENALHHFSTVTVTGSEIEVITYGVVGDGSPPIVVDRFDYKANCAPEFSFTTPPAILDVAEQAAQTVSVNVSVPDPAVTWSSNVPWLTVTAEPQPGSALVALDAAQLSVGTHVALVRAELAGYDPTTLLVVARVGVPLPTGQLVSFSDPNRASYETLDGAVLPDSPLLGLVPDQPLVGVRFTLDGVPLRDEGTAPFDVGGGGASTLDDGLHTLEATLTTASGATSTLRAEFTVATVCVGVVCTTDPSTSVVAGAPPAPTAPATASATSAPTATPSNRSLDAPIGAPLSTLAPMVASAGQSSPATGGDWWSKWPTLMVAVALVGLVVGLINRPGSRTVHPRSPAQTSPLGPTSQQGGTQ